MEVKIAKLSVAVVIANSSRGFSSHNFYLNQDVKEYDQESGLEIVGEAAEDLSVYGLWGSNQGGSSEQVEAIAASERLELLEDKLQARYANKPLRNKVPLIRAYLDRLSNINCLNTRDIKLEGKGIPMSVVVLLNDKALLVNMGGSKIYLFRNDLLDEPKEAGDAINAMPMELQKSDTMLICSDGMMEFLTKAETTKAFTNYDSSRDIANQLVETALANGSRERLTVMVLKVEEIKPKKAHRIINLRPGKYKAIIGVAILSGLLLAGGIVLAQNILSEQTATQDSNQISQIQQDDENTKEPSEKDTYEQEPPDNPNQEENIDEDPRAPREDLDVQNEEISLIEPEPEPQPEPEPDNSLQLQGTYEVKPGDSLFGISMLVYERNEVERIKQFNNMTSDDIAVGDIIKLPQLD